MMVPGQSWQCSVSEEAQPPQPAFADSNGKAKAISALVDGVFALAGVASAKAKMTFAEAFVAASPAASTRLWLALWLASPILRGCTATVFHSPSSL